MAKSGVKKKRKSTHSPRSTGRSGVPGSGWGSGWGRGRASVRVRVS